MIAQKLERMFVCSNVCAFLRFLCNSLLYKKNVFINVREMIKSPWDFHGDDLNSWIMDWSSNIVAAGSEMVWINRHWFFNLSFAFWDIEILTWYLNMIQNQIPCILLLSITNLESRILKFDRNGFNSTWSIIIQILIFGHSIPICYMEIYTPFSCQWS